VPTALWIARQTAEALSALHRAGFVHGDVKPDNIRIVADGHAMLLDLGFAHRPGENTAFLQEGYILGTLNYLAPELCSRQPVDGLAADLFGLGVTLFEMLAGQLPYAPGNAAETMRRHDQETARDLRQQGLRLPPGLPELVNRLLSRDPAGRPRAASLVQQLVGFEIAAMSRRRSA
jgi:serine/threonine protein kinase